MLMRERQPKFELRLTTGLQSVTQPIDGPWLIAIPLCLPVGDNLRIRRPERGRNRRHCIEQRGSLAPFFQAGPAAPVLK